MLTTSRAPLGLSSESVYPLPELDLPTTVELFGQRARAARPGVDLPAGGGGGAVPPPRRAAARGGAGRGAGAGACRSPRSPGGWTTGSRLLRGGAAGRAASGTAPCTPSSTGAGTCSTPAGQAAMRALSVFPGGFTADAARQLLGDGDALPILEHLVDQSLLKVADTPSGTRFRMLETVREFSAARRAAAGETERVVGRFLAWARDFGMAHHECAVRRRPRRRRGSGSGPSRTTCVQALRHGLAARDGATVAATRRRAGRLWIVESNYPRLAALADGDRPGAVPLPAGARARRGHPDAATRCVHAVLVHGLRARRASPLVALRRLPPAPPDTLIRAAGRGAGRDPRDAGLTATRAAKAVRQRRAAGGRRRRGRRQLLWETSATSDGALAAARRMLAAFEHGPATRACSGHGPRPAQRAVPASWSGARRRYGPPRRPRWRCCGGSALARLLGVRWGMVLANLQPATSTRPSAGWAGEG